MVDDGVIAACATAAEAKVARRAGLRAAVVGLCACRGAPEGRLVSFGLAGALNGLEIGTVLDATKVVDEHGRTLWEGPGLGVAGARRGTIVSARRVVDDPEERRRLLLASGAIAVDMESGPLAQTGRLRGVLRAISDTPERPIGVLDRAVRPDGTADVGGFLRALASHPRATLRALAGVRRALGALRQLGQPAAAGQLGRPAATVEPGERVAAGSVERS